MIPPSLITRLETFVRRPLLTAAVLSSAVVLLAGCSGSGDGSNDAATGTNAGASQPSATPAAAAKLKSGTDLKPLLPTIKDMPKGFTVVKDQVRDTGGDIGPADKLTPVSTPNCADLDGNSWSLSLGGSSAFAQTGFASKDGSNISIEIDSYEGNVAQKIMTGYKKIFTGCKTYKTKGDGQTGTEKVVLKPGLDVGDASLHAVATSTMFQGGITYAAVKVGPQVVTVTWSSQSKDLGAKGVDLATTIATQLQS